MMNSQDARSLWKSFALILLLTGFFVIYLLVKPGDPASVTFVDNVVQGLLEGVGLFLTLPFFLRDGYRVQLFPTILQRGVVSVKTVRRWVPLLFGLGILSYIVGQALWTYNEDIAHLAVLFPTWADAGFLGSYPFLLLAFLLLPSRPLLTGTRTRIILDGLLIVVGVITLGWYFILGPTILQGATTLAGQIIGTAYPFATLLLILCLILLIIHTNDWMERPVVLILSLALIVIIVTDSIYDYQELHNLYVTGGLLDVGWPLGYMLIGLAARAIRLQVAKNRSTAPSPAAILSQKTTTLSSLWRSLLPYLFVPAVVLLLVYVQYLGKNTVLEEGVRLGTTLLMILLLIRQAFAIRETIIQNNTLRMVQQDVSTKNAALNNANTQLEEQARQIEEAYKQEHELNELKDQFLLHINHELRTPLTTMQGYLELMHMGSTQLPEKERGFLLSARESSEELMLLVNNVLDVTSIIAGQTPHCGKLSLASIVRYVLEQIDPRNVQAYQIQIDIPEEMVVWADQQFLRQIFQNLLSNAFKYTPQGTTIRISAILCESASQELARVQVSVKDEGPGIPPEELAQLFGKFVRLERDRSGTVAGSGLGLYICKQLVESMQGRIWVESTGIEGEGSLFCFTLLVNSPDIATIQG
jgi:signal transduction histidine kinase